MKQIPPIKPNRIIVLVISIIIASYIWLWIGRLTSVIAYPDPYYLPTIKRTVLQLFVFITLAFTNYYLLKEFLRLRIFTVVPIIIASILGILSSAYMHNMGLPLDYISTGDYLRDVHGVNWYTMDMGNWGVATILYFASIYAFTIYLFFRIAINRLQKKTS